MPFVDPKDNCPHVSSIPLSSYKHINVWERCEACNDGSENWFCLGAKDKPCGKILCSRYVHGDMAKHAQAEDHVMAVSFSDLSVWCYKCEEYIKSPLLSGVLSICNEAKFGESIPTAAAASSSASDEEPPQPKPSVSISGKQRTPEEEAALEQAGRMFAAAMRQAFGIEEEQGDQSGPQFTFEDFPRLIAEGKAKNVILLTGAGLSTSAGIPDFRSPKTGLYANLQKYDLPYPTAIFELDYFREKPEPFFTLCRELIDVEKFRPTIGHLLIKLLEEEGVLLRNFTQNIDDLESVAGISLEKIISAHGHFRSAKCIDCAQEHSKQHVMDAIFSEVLIPRCTSCKGLVKPDIVFFGESLPTSFFKAVKSDFDQCDLLITVGTSLKVQPFAQLVGLVPAETPRLLINREKGGVFEYTTRKTDVFHGFDIDRSAFKFAELMGKKERLLELYAATHPSEPLPAFLRPGWVEPEEDKEEEEEEEEEEKLEAGLAKAAISE